MTLPENVRKRRKQFRLSQADLSRKSGVPQTTISAIETGARSPTAETIVMLARGLECSVDDLLDSTQEENKNPIAETDDEIKEEIIRLVGQLPQEALPQIRDFAAFLKSRRAEQ